MIANIGDDATFVFALRDAPVKTTTCGMIPYGMCDREWLSIVYDVAAINHLISAWSSLGITSYLIKISRSLIFDCGLCILKAPGGTSYILGGSGIPQISVIACIKIDASVFN